MAKYKMNPDGTLGEPSKVGWEHLTDLSSSDYQYMYSYNQAKEQFDKNYAFQREQYEQGILNDAQQKAQLGINPAAEGANLTTTSFSGASGHGTPGTGSGSSAAGMSFLLGLLGQGVNLSDVIAGIGLKKKQGEAALKNAEANLMNAETNAKSQASQEKVNNATIAKFGAEVENLGVQTAVANLEKQMSEMDFNDYKMYLEKIHGLEVTDNMVNAVKGLYNWSLIGIGLGSLFNKGEPNNTGDIGAMILAIDKLDRKQRSAVNDFFADNPSALYSPTMLTSKVMYEWINNNMSYDEVYESLKGNYGL